MSARLKGEGTRPTKVSTEEILALQEGLDFVPSSQQDTIVVGVLKCGCHGWEFGTAEELAAHLNTPKKRRKSTLVSRDSRRTGKLRRI